MIIVFFYVQDITDINKIQKTVHDTGYKHDKKPEKNKYAINTHTAYAISQFI